MPDPFWFCRTGGKGLGLQHQLGLLVKIQAGDQSTYRLREVQELQLRDQTHPGL